MTTTQEALNKARELNEIAIRFRQKAEWLNSMVNMQQNHPEEPPDYVSEFDYLLAQCASELISDIDILERITAASAEAQPSAPVAQAFPERDTSKPAEQQGIFRKFDVRRVDGSDAPGGKHYGCRYFVIDMDHDQYAGVALSPYGMACAKTHPQLSADLLTEFPAQAERHVLTDDDIRAHARKYCEFDMKTRTYNILSYELEEDFLTMCHSLLSTAPQVEAKEGWKLMPPKLTQEMEAACVNAARQYMAETGGNSPSVIYEAAFSAAPSSQKEGGQQK